MTKRQMRGIEHLGLTDEFFIIVSRTFANIVELQAEKGPIRLPNGSVVLSSDDYSNLCNGDADWSDLPEEN